ncbi:dihydrofolate reductase-like isoform X2 [Amblyraja radiata]|uniref:dihydrofolate reductase-like isoform X2 n=1 Tax=Amblyraja radiata TaxID=386614 RepID=UPI001401BB61|nr:dihydrofolate reductase-like isoform X2 [Amblyraja radiata]
MRERGGAQEAAADGLWFRRSPPVADGLEALAPDCRGRRGAGDREERPPALGTAERVQLVCVASGRRLRSDSVPAGTDFLCRDLASAVQLASLPPLSDHIETIWVLGGTRPFQEAWRYPNCDRIYLTNIMANFHCDTFFPDFDQDIFQLQDKFPGVPSEIQEENGIQYKFQVFQKVLSNDPEPRLQYA